MQPSSENAVRYLPQPSPTIDRRWKPNVELAPNKCPRCESSNTKFCYYNNYSLTQPRYFCKGCRRYWTKGGSLRNVPVGARCRKSRLRGRVLIPSGRTATLRPDVNVILSGSAGSSSDGSIIDLADLYAKFSNRINEPGYQSTELLFDVPNGFMVENMEITGTTSSTAHHQNDNIPFLDPTLMGIDDQFHGRFLGSSGLDDHRFDIDSSGTYGSNLLSVDESTVVSGNLSWFGYSPEMLHQPLLQNQFGSVTIEKDSSSSSSLFNSNWTFVD